VSRRTDTLLAAVRDEEGFLSTRSEPSVASPACGRQGRNDGVGLRLRRNDDSAVICESNVSAALCKVNGD
jgi:hypothetical protein